MWVVVVFAVAVVSVSDAVTPGYSYPDSLPGLYPDDPYAHMNFTTECFGDLGCFYTGPPWYHPLYRPYSVAPEPLHTKFLLSTRANQLLPYELNITSESLKASPFNASAPLKVLIHGYEENKTLYYDIIKELLKYDHFNIINVDWAIDNHPPLHQAAANARIVGAYTAKLIKFLMDQTGLKPGEVHVIGHSLGGQLVGYVGERIPNLGRITGLDPAGPYFQAAPKEVRLDRSDAVFVDVMQTNVGNSVYTGIGLEQIYGHAVFSVNGGFHQPGCDYKSAIPLIGKHDKNRVLNQCSHLRALDYFQSSISTCQYNATACFSYEGYKAGLCKKMPFHNRLGLHATKPPFQLVYYLDTASSSPYCEAKQSWF